MIRQRPEDFSSSSELDQAVLAAGFAELLESGAPVALERVAERIAVDLDRVEGVVEELRSEGRAVLTEDAQLAGILGVSAIPTRHEILFDGKRRWTWCAYDAVGVLSALGCDGIAQSTSLLSGQPIEVAFAAGRPVTEEVVLFFATHRVESVVDEWCPLVNFFESEDAAEEWKDRTGTRGDVVSLEAAARTGGERWRQFLPDPAIR